MEFQNLFEDENNKEKKIEEEINLMNIFSSAKTLLILFKDNNSFFEKLSEEEDIKNFEGLEKYIKRFLVGIYNIIKFDIFLSRENLLHLRNIIKNSIWETFLDEEIFSDNKFFAFINIKFACKPNERSLNCDKDDLSFENIDKGIDKNEDINININDVSEIKSEKNNTIGDIKIDNDDNTLVRYKLELNKFDNSQIIEKYKNKIFTFFTSFFSFLNISRFFKEKKSNKSNTSNLLDRILIVFFNIKKSLLIYSTEKIKIEAFNTLSNLQNRYIKDFFNLFEINITRNESDRNKLAEFLFNLIKEKKSTEKILEIISILNLKEDNSSHMQFLQTININLFINNLQRNKQNIGLMKKAIKIFPKYGKQVIQQYLNEFESKFATEIYQELKLDETISENLELKNKIILIAKLKCMNFHYRCYKKFEIHFIHVVEQFKNDYEILKNLFKTLIDNNNFIEAYFLLKYLDFNDEIFSRILVSDFYKLGSQLISWNNNHVRYLIISGEKDFNYDIKKENNFYNYNNKNTIKQEDRMFIDENSQIKAIAIKKDNDVQNRDFDKNLEIKVEVEKEEEIFDINQIKNKEKNNNEIIDSESALYRYDESLKNDIHLEKIDKSEVLWENLDVIYKFFNPLNSNEKNIFTNISVFKNFVYNLPSIPESILKSDKKLIFEILNKIISTNSLYSYTHNSLLINQIKLNDENIALKYYTIIGLLKKFLLYFVKNPSINKADYLDDFAPADPQLMHIPITEEKVLFISDIEEFKKIKKLFSNSKLIGIDMEWKSKISKLEPDHPCPSIIQISDGNICFILDYPKLKMEKNFYDHLNDTFTGKIFIGFSFHNDINSIDDPKIKSFFALKHKSEVIDLEIEFKKELDKKTLSLSNLTKEIFNNGLCKMEQLSNWNNRPLRRRQLHYAALDSVILVSLYQKLIYIRKDKIKGD